MEGGNHAHMAGFWDIFLFVICAAFYIGVDHVCDLLLWEGFRASDSPDPTY